jgi:methyl-accepting chemotaxis protein
VTQNIAQVEEATKKIGSESNQVLDAANQLYRQADNLNAEVSKYLSSVRAS